jgi:hypothetical protein
MRDYTELEMELIKQLKNMLISVGKLQEDEDFTPSELIVKSDSYIKSLKVIQDNVIEVGDRVKNQDGVFGTVVYPGPYGDEPLQIKTDDGIFYGSISENGKSTYLPHVWILQEKKR